ncbi:MAG: TetR/AcrR family transcriptional regulator [Sphaerochaetaceae bacterium]
MWNLSQKALAQALKELLNTKNLDNITVKDISSYCGLSRQTFYYHFSDVFDLVRWIFSTEALDELGDSNTFDTWQQGFLKVFAYCKNNKVLVLNAYHSVNRKSLEDFLYSQCFSLLMDVVDEEAIGMHVSHKHKVFIADFYKYAFVGMLEQWLDDGMEQDAMQIITQISILIEGDVKKALQKFESK